MVSSCHLVSLQVCLVGATILFPQAQNPRARAIKTHSLKTLKKSGATERHLPSLQGSFETSEAWAPPPPFFSNQQKAGMAPWASVSPTMPQVECLSQLRVFLPRWRQNPSKGMSQLRC